MALGFTAIYSKGPRQTEQLLAVNGQSGHISAAVRGRDTEVESVYTDADIRAIPEKHSKRFSAVQGHGPVFGAKIEIQPAPGRIGDFRPAIPAERKYELDAASCHRIAVVRCLYFHNRGRLRFGRQRGDSNRRCFGK